MKLPHFFLFFVLIPFIGISQNQPRLVPQINFESGLDEVLSSGSQNAFLVISGDKYTLVDQSSKIQLGTLIFDAGSWGAQGVGKTRFWGDSSILISTGREIKITDPIKGTIDTFFNALLYPEMVENFIPLPNSEHKVLIHTKTYPMDKDSNVSAFELGETVKYQPANNCKLYLYNALTKKIEASTATPYLFTTFSNQLNKGKLLAGTLQGDVIAIDSLLNQQKLFHAFDTTVHSIISCGEYIACIPALAHRFVNNKVKDGGESIYFFKNSNRQKVITFKKQEPEGKNLSSIGASANIFRAFYKPTAHSMLVNYGFSRLVYIDLSNFDTTHLKVASNVAKFYCFDNYKDNLLAATSETLNIFSSAEKQELFNLKHQKFLPVFKPFDEKNSYKTLQRMYDAQGNYHIVAYKYDYSADTIIIYSSNKTQPTTIACRWCKFSLDVKNNLLIAKKNRNAKVFKLPFSKLQKRLYTINFESPPPVFELVFTTENIDREKRFSSVYNVQQLSPQHFLVIAKYYKNKKPATRVAILSTNNTFLFDKKGYTPNPSNHFVERSPTGKYIALNYKKGNKQVLEVWDWKAGKKVYSQKFSKKKDLQHFTFDKTQDVLWYGVQSYTPSQDIDIAIYAVDVNAPRPKATPKFNDNRFFSFEIDMQNDRMAFEAYADIYLAQLSTQKILWQKTPQNSYFKIQHLPNGFAYANKTELHTLLNSNHYLYFTSYGNKQPVEIANNYLYKGSKQAINNLAFVYRRKSFLPADYDIYFNRPDKVLQLSGSENEEYNTLISEAYGKRSRKVASVSLDELLTQSPKLEISNKSQLPIAVNQKYITLNIKAQSKNPIIRLHIIANGVPIYGKNGLPLEKQSTLTLSPKIELQSGANVLQVYVEDEKGIISPTETVNIVANYEYTPKTYFIGIGIDEFVDSTQNLSYSVKDITDLNTAFKEKLGKQLISYTFTNAAVKRDKVAQLKTILHKTNVNDRVIISYSGHGLLDKEFNYYLSTTDIDFKKPQVDGLPYTILENLLDSIPARQKLLMIDACHSGEVDKEAINNMEVVLGDSTNNLAQGSKSGIELLVDAPKVGLKNSFELMQELFVDVGRGTGTNIISAAAGTQVAYEKGNLKNGVFTYCILQMLKEKPNCTLQELKDFVSTEVEKLTNGLQKPTSRSETVGFNWQVW
jgi:hypothetical protein